MSTIKAAYTLLVGAYATNISVFSFDPASNALQAAGSFAHPANPTWLETRCGLFAAAESDARVVTRLTLEGGHGAVAEQVAVGGDPVHCE